MLFKQGAMFGLDARIALAIFGALSVISGASLYSAIQDARAVSLYQEANEIIKATEAYYLDTGQELTISSVSTYAAELGALETNINNIANWNGPYYSFQYTDNVHGLNNFGGSDTTRAFFMILNSDAWTPGNGSCRNDYTDTEYCDFYLMFLTYETDIFDSFLQIFTYLDEKYDGGNGFNEGNIRYKDTYVTDRRIYFKARRYK